MILKDNREIESKSDRFHDEEVPPLKDYSDIEIVYLVEREALTITHVLNVYVKEDDVDQQRKIFHTRRHIQTRYVV